MIHIFCLYSKKTKEFFGFETFGSIVSAIDKAELYITENGPKQVLPNLPPSGCTDWSKKRRMYNQNNVTDKVNVFSFVNEEAFLLWKDEQQKSGKLDLTILV